MVGDFQWTTEYALKALRANNVPEFCIPDFIKNYEEIENRYLAGDLSILVGQNVSFNRSKILKIIFSGYTDSGENLKVSTFITSINDRCFNTYNRLKDMRRDIIT